MQWNSAGGKAESKDKGIGMRGRNRDGTEGGKRGGKDGKSNGLQHTRKNKDVQTLLHHLGNDQESPW